MGFENAPLEIQKKSTIFFSTYKILSVEHTLIVYVTALAVSMSTTAYQSNLILAVTC